MTDCVTNAMSEHHKRMTRPDALRLTVPGEFERSKSYRRNVKGIAATAIAELQDWPVDVVEVNIDSINTASSHKLARQFANMLHGVVFRKSLIIKGISYREDEDGPRIDVAVRRVEL